MKLNKIVYNTPIDVYSKEVIEDRYGRQKENYVHKYHLYASVKWSYGKEYDIAEQQGYHRQGSLKLRFGPLITADMQIKLNGEIFNIKSVENIDQADELLEVMIYQEVMRHD